MTALQVDRKEMTEAASQPEFAYQDDAGLVAALGEHGVRHLSVAEAATPYAAIDATTLIARLASHADPRLREALIPLFLRQPVLAELAPSMVGQLQPQAADVLRHFYTAAVYLQRLWLSMLRMHLGSFALLPDYFGQMYDHLPAPEVKFGEAGLRGLAEIQCARTGLDWLSVYKSTMDLFLQQLNLEQAYHG